MLTYPFCPLSNPVNPVKLTAFTVLKMRRK